MDLVLLWNCLAIPTPSDNVSVRVDNLSAMLLYSNSPLVKDSPSNSVPFYYDIITHKMESTENNGCSTKPIAKFTMTKM